MLNSLQGEAHGSVFELELLETTSLQRRFLTWAGAGFIFGAGKLWNVGLPNLWFWLSIAQHNSRDVLNKRRNSGHFDRGGTPYHAGSTIHPRATLLRTSKSYSIEVWPMLIQDMHRYPCTSPMVSSGRIHPTLCKSLMNAPSINLVRKMMTTADLIWARWIERCRRYVTQHVDSARLNNGVGSCRRPCGFRQVFNEIEEVKMRFRSMTQLLDGILLLHWRWRR